MKLIKRMKPLGLAVMPLTIAPLMGCNNSACDGCLMEPDPGNCFAAIPKYYYDQQSNSCKEFIWGGCGGTIPFETMFECENCKCD